MRILTRFVAAVVLTTLALFGIPQGSAQEPPDWNDGLPQQYESVWKVHDMHRPHPRPVQPGARASDAPSDAIVLFDGTSLAEWRPGKKGHWKLESGYMEANDSGGMQTKRTFGDCQLHLEYRAPNPPQRVSQYRGNSGIFFMGKYEVQVLDNYDNGTYSDGYIGSVYGQHPPLVFAGRKPGEWQTFDIIFRAPRFEGDKLVEEARVTAFLNGVLVQHNAKVFGGTNWRQLATYKAHDPKLPLRLQDHGDKQKVRFRNIWIRELDLSPKAIDNAD